MNIGAIIETVIITAVVTLVISYFVFGWNYKSVHYSSFLHMLYGSERFAVRRQYVVVWFNSILSESHPQFILSESEIDDCDYIFSIYREHTSRIYFDGGNALFDAHREKWLRDNKKKIVKLFREKDRILFYLSAEEFLSKHAEDSHFRDKIIHDYYAITDFGTTYYKMLLACTLAIEKINNINPSENNAKHYENVLSQKRINT